MEHSTFTPLVLSTIGGMGRAATTFYRRLAAMLSEKRDVPYSKMIGWIRCRLSLNNVCQGSQIICKQASKWSTSRPCRTPVSRGSAPRCMNSDTLWTNAFVHLYKSFSFPFLSFRAKYQDAHGRLVLQVYLGSNTLEFSAIRT